MDANGLRFWMLADHQDWQGDDHITYDDTSRALQLRSTRVLPPLPATPVLEETAEARVEQVPQTRDAFGTRAYWDAVRGAVMSTGALPDAVPIYVPAAGEQPTSLAMGYDGVLYMAIGGGVVLQDRRDRWEPVALTAAGFTAWRLAADPQGGVWAVDRQQRRLARVHGLPRPTRPYGPYAPSTFRPCEENPAPPRLDVLDTATFPDATRVVALACSPAGRVAVLIWAADGTARLSCLTQTGTFAAPITLRDIRFPYSISWVSETAIAVLLVNVQTEAPVYPADRDGVTVDPVGDFYPLRDHNGGPFLHGVVLPPHYPVAAGSEPLYHLSLPTFAAHGGATNVPVIDSGHTDTAWHRLYIEAVIPPHGAIKVFLATSDDPVAPVADADWHMHYLGEQPPQAVPQGVWMASASEIPFHAGLLSCESEKDRAGLFTVLIQRTNRPVRTLRGRFLRVRIALHGDGRITPQLFALRAYASRFSYVSRYLPELYHETAFGPDANQVLPLGAPSTPADFLERFVDNFEGVLTLLEDRMANAYLLTDPQTTPDTALAWLGSWIGMTFDPAYPEAQRRRLLPATPELYRYRGTARGLGLALDIATAGGVAGGEIVLLEDFRLRRTFATILGADLADEDDPVLGGIVSSGNSYVGDTLFLGDENRREFLALFRPEVSDMADEEAIHAFFERLAHRVTVLVHQEVLPQDLALIRRIVELEIPAHVSARVLSATRGFLIGMAALVGVDTYLTPARRPGPVIVNASYLGLRDLIQNPPSLDPRLAGGGPRAALPPPPPPVASLSAPASVGVGQALTLDASGSQAFAGQDIIQYLWTLREP
jgi:phage tail-like protein